MSHSEETYCPYCGGETILDLSKKPPFSYHCDKCKVLVTKFIKNSIEIKRIKTKNIKKKKNKKKKAKKKKTIKSKKIQKAKKIVKEKKISKENKEKLELAKQFGFLLEDAIKEDDYFTSYLLISEIKEFKSLEKIMEEDSKKLEDKYEKKLQEKLTQLKFVDVSNKIIATTFYCMRQTSNLALRGPPGVGKSYFAKSILPELWKKNGTFPHVITIQPDKNMDVASLVVEKGLKEGSTVPEKGQIHDAMTLAKEGKRIILVLEEINQWPTKVIKDLNDFLQERRIEKKISGVDILLDCPKENLLVIANYNPEGETLGEDETGSVSSRFIFCDIPFPSKQDIQKIIAMNVDDQEFQALNIGYERKKTTTRHFLRSMTDICFSIRSTIQQGDLGMMAMQLGTRHIINFSEALFENNTVTEAILKTLVDPILEKYVREGIKANVEPSTYNDYIRTIFKAVKQILGAKEVVNEKDLNSLKNGLDITIDDLFKLRNQNAFNRELQVIKSDKPSKPNVREKKNSGYKNRKNSFKNNKKAYLLALEKKFVIKCIASNKIIEDHQTDLMGNLRYSCKYCKKHHKFMIENTRDSYRVICLDCNNRMNKIPTLFSWINFYCNNKKCKNHDIRIQIKEEERTSKKYRDDVIICPKCHKEMDVMNGKKRILLCLNCKTFFSLPIQGEISILKDTCLEHGYSLLKINPNERKEYHICPYCYSSNHKTCNDCKKKCLGGVINQK